MGTAYLIASDPLDGEQGVAALATGTSGFKITPSSVGAIQFGRSVAGAGDVNGDGKADLIVAAPAPGGGHMGLTSNSGESYLFFGRSAASFSDLGLTDAGKYAYLTASSPLAGVVSGIGNFNGAGTDDLIVGEGAYWGGGGSVAVVSGASVGTSPAPAHFVLNDSFSGVSWSGYRLTGALNANMGKSVAAIGSIDKDAYPDVAIGSSGEDIGNSNTGSVRIIYGASGAFGGNTNCAAAGSYSDINAGGSWSIGCNPVPKPVGWLIGGEEVGQNFGFSVAAGDVNGDGNIDLVIGAPNTSSGKGRVYVVFGSGTRVTTTLDLFFTSLNGSNGFIIDGVASGDQLGTAVAVLDMNGDGTKDIVVGTPSANSNDGQVTVVMGKAGLGSSGTVDISSLGALGGSVSVGTDGFTVAGSGSEKAGTSLANAGDINGDGREDLLIGAPGYNSGQGKAYLIRLNP